MTHHARFSYRASKEIGIRNGIGATRSAIVFHSYLKQ